MKTYIPMVGLVCAALMLAGCGSQEPMAPAPVASPDLPTVELPGEASPAPPPAAPAFEDDLDEETMSPREAAIGPELDGPGELFAPPIDESAGAEPGMRDSAATDGESPGVTRAVGEALLKGITEGVTGRP